MRLLGRNRDIGRIEKKDGDQVGLFIVSWSE